MLGGYICCVCSVHSHSALPAFQCSSSVAYDAICVAVFPVLLFYTLLLTAFLLSPPLSLSRFLSVYAAQQVLNVGNQLLFYMTCFAMAVLSVIVFVCRRQLALVGFCIDW